MPPVVSRIWAEDGSRTRNLQLGRLELYQLSYFRFAQKPAYAILCVGQDGFEPPKQLSNRFTVCPIWPLWYCPCILYSEEKRRAEEGTRTPDQLITNQLLWPTELHRLIGCNTIFKRTFEAFNYRFKRRFLQKRSAKLNNIYGVTTFFWKKIKKNPPQHLRGTNL